MSLFTEATGDGLGDKKDPPGDLPEKVLVAGAAGFIGLHLCRALLARGSAVLALDNFCTGDREALTRLAQESTTDGSAGLVIAEVDISGPLDMIFYADKIINLACPASPAHYSIMKLETLRASVFGTQHLLDLALWCGAKFLQASTSEVYGEPQENPQTETLPGYVDSMSDRACYTEGKRTSETLCELYRQQGVDVRVARIFNSYGPGMLEDDGRVVSTFVMQALDKVPLTVYGDGSQTRSLCYVKDTVAGLLALIDYEGTLDYPVNIGNPEEVSVLDLADQISQEVNPGKPVDISFDPLPGDDPTRRCPDISRAQAILGWTPEVTRAQGLGQTVSAFRSKRPVQELPDAGGRV